ncbi:MAG: ABC transporter permease [Gemmataceae bacterium]
MSFQIGHALRLGVRGIAANSLRSGLTALGIVLGVASVIVMLAVGEAARYQALKQLEDLGANTVLLKSVKPPEDNTDKKGTDLFAYGLTYADLDRIRTSIPTVVDATPMRSFPKTIRVRERKLDGRLVAVTPDFFRQNNLTVSRGRGIEFADEEKADNVAVIGMSAADVLFPAEDPIGKTIAIDGLGQSITFTIIGVTEDKSLATGSMTGGGGDSEFSRVVFIPFSTDRSRIGRELISFKNGFNVERLEVSQLTVSVVNSSEVSRTAAVLQSMVDQFHPNKDVQVFVPLELLRKAEETQRMFTLILGAIAGISLVVGGIGIMNIMLASVTERTREIGVRRALGAKKRDIGMQFLVETIALSAGGGLIGVGVGILLALALRNWVNIPTLIAPWAPALAFATSLFVGLASGLYPARRAARLDPIEALRHT